MNLIYIVCHDLGRHLGCYDRKVKTPNLDALAGSGIQFTNAFCNTAVCSPSRATCMTGLCAHNNGMMGLSHFGWRIRSGVKTIVDILNDAGYETVHCGLSHEGEENNSRYQTDFEVSWRSTHAENAIDNAIAWLRSRQPKSVNTPFYLNIGTLEAHPSVWRNDVDERGLASRFQSVYGGPVPENEVTVPPPTPDVPLTREEFARFEAGIRHLDAQIGRLMNAIHELDLKRNTTIVFTTDHGMNDLRGKGTLYDRGTEVALLMQLPTQYGCSGKIDYLIQNIDLTPTLLEAAGIPIPDNLQGRSFWPLILTRSYIPHERIFLEWNFGGPQDDYSPIRAVRTNTHKLIHNYGPHRYGFFHPDEIPEHFTRDRMLDKRFKDYGPAYQHPNRMLPEYELYDLRSDPDELRNLLEGSLVKKESLDLKAELESCLMDWMQATSDHILSGTVPRLSSAPGFHYQ